MAQQRVDYLEDDPISVPGQNFVLISVVSPGSNQKADKCGVKVRGVFATRQEADAHAKKLQKLDPHYDIYCADVGKWLLIPPDPNGIEDQEYAEDYLNNLMKSYRENQALAKQHFEERKKSILEEGLDKHLLPHERVAQSDDAPGPSGAEPGPSGEPGPSSG